MGLDVYVGSLTRYYVAGPADVVERIARHQDVPATDGLEAEEVIRAAVVRWREGLTRWLGDRLAGPLDWDESGPAPCFTDKPGWDGYGGTLLLAAHDEHPEPPPPHGVSAHSPDDPAPPRRPPGAPAARGRLRRLARRPRLPGRLGPGSRLPLPPAADPGAVAPLPVRVHRPHPGHHRRRGRARLQRRPARPARAAVGPPPPSPPRPPRSSPCRPPPPWTPTHRSRRPTAIRCRPPPAAAWPCCAAWP